MIFRAAVCPGAPLLIPGLADDLSAQVPQLVDACARAVRTLGAADRVLLLSSGPGARDERERAQELSVVHPSGTVVSSSLITGSAGSAHFTGRLDGPALTVPDGPTATAPAGPSPGVGVIVGAALLACADVHLPVTAVELARYTAEVAAVLGDAATSADRVGVLVVAEGSASRGAMSPGGGSPDAVVLDASLATALAAGDPTALAQAARVHPESAARLLFTSGPAFQALAEMTAAHPPERAELLSNQAPLGVGYLVAAWSWAPLGRR